MRRGIVLSVVGVLAIGLLMPDLVKADPAIIDGFVESVQKSDKIDDETRQKVIDVVASMRTDEYDRYVAISEGLCVIYPEYAKTLEAMGEEDYAAAMAKLTEYSKSDDPYLAADASFYLARSYMLDEKYEDAMPHLKEVTAKFMDKTVQGGNALYLRGISESYLLQRADAIKTLTKYVDEVKDAPERMKIGAWRQLEALKSYKEGDLFDVYERMDFSRRHLDLEKSGDRTQEEQEKIVAMLDKLIKQAEQQESGS